MLLPEGAASRLADAAVLWNAAEAAEKRKDAQVAREIVLALPADRVLTTKDRIELARSFAEQHFVAKGLAQELCWPASCAAGIAGGGKTLRAEGRAGAVTSPSVAPEQRPALARVAQLPALALTLALGLAPGQAGAGPLALLQRRGERWTGSARQRVTWPRVPASTRAWYRSGA